MQSIGTDAASTEVKGTCTAALEQGGDVDGNDGSDDDLFVVFRKPSGKVATTEWRPVEPNVGTKGHFDHFSHDGGVSAPPALAPKVDGDNAFRTGLSVEPTSKNAVSTSAPFMNIVTTASNGTYAAAASEQSTQRNQSGLVVREPNSDIRVNRPTKACEQLPVVLVQYPFSLFGSLQRSLKSGNGQMSLPVTVVGTVINKTDPKKSGAGRTYGVVHLWNMRGPFVQPSDEVSILLCGTAFDTHYTKIVNGLVVAVSNLQKMKSQCDSKMITAGHGSSSNCGILKVTSSDSLRVLGYALDMGTCQSVQQRSGDRCNNVVNKRLSSYCSYHASNLRQVARGTDIGFGGKPPSSPSVNTRRAAGGISHANFAGVCPSGVAASSGSRRSLLHQQTGFLTVKGSSGLPVSSPASSDVVSAGNAYATVVAGAVLPVSTASQNVKRVLGSNSERGGAGSYTPADIGVGGQGRVVLRAAAAAEDAKELERTLRLALQSGQPGPKRPRDEDHLSEWSEVRAQFSPLPVSHDTSAFAPLKSFSGVDSVVRRRKNYGQRVVTRNSDGTRNAIVSAVERRLRSEGALSKYETSVALKEAKDGKEQKKYDVAGGVSAAPSPSLLARLADSRHSANDELVALDERNRIERLGERLLRQDKAIEALTGVTEQKVRAFYCRQCDRWYVRHNERCKLLQHIVEARDTEKHFVQCEHCNYKTSILGDVRPSKLLPRCPRCCAEAQWRMSNAAPETVLVVECQGEN
uniref:Protein MCM10 homolog n=1 Tax=Trypanosoma congolense (strain IL3000) TaxID=1068625 RepID=G0UTC4_TRYCI|nr:conserved hypothetical protein [Trypanosoma congolense IL3000]